MARSGVSMCCKGEVTGWVVDDVERNWRVSYDRWLHISSSVGEQVELPSLTTTTWKTGIPFLSFFEKHIFIARKRRWMWPLLGWRTWTTFSLFMSLFACWPPVGRHQWPTVKRVNQTLVLCTINTHANIPTYLSLSYSYSRFLFLFLVLVINGAVQ